MTVGLTRRVVLGGGAVGLLAPTMPLPVLAQTGSSDFSEFNAWIDASLTAENVPGASLSVIAGGKVAHVYSFGVDDLESSLAASPDRHFVLASISKTFTTLLCMLLAAEGKIDLDADLNDMVGFRVRNPYFPEDRITLRHILTHTSSMQDFNYAFYNTTYSRRTEPQLPTEMMQTLYGTDGTAGQEGWFGRYAPGESGYYCTAAFGLISLAIHAATGLLDWQIMRDRIFAPLGMTTTSFDPRDIPRENYVTNYGRVENGVGLQLLDWEADPDTEGFSHMIDGDRRFRADFAGYTGYVRYHPDYTFGPYADGGVITSITDLAKYAAMLAANGRGPDGSQVIATDILDAALEVDNFSVDGEAQGIGFNRAYPHRMGQAAWGHNGGDIGTRTSLRFDRESGIATVFHSNLETDTIGSSDTDPELFRRALYALEGQPYEP
jgi:CubicO group peptidase (beta-lactamase class C family)